MKTEINVLARVLLVLMLVPLCGCHVVVVPAGSTPGITTPGSTAIGPVSALPAAPTTTTASLPPVTVGQGAPAPQPVPGVNQPGTSASSPPSAALPPPTNATDYITYLKQKYGIQSITGSNATLPELQKVDSAYSLLPPGLYANLHLDFQPADADPSASKAPPGSVVLGYWGYADANGNAMPQSFDPTQVRGGVIFFLQPQESRWTYTHETCHHISLWADTTFGAKLMTDLGYARTDTDPTATPYLNLQTWGAKTVDNATYPTDYARVNNFEHVAELMTCYVRGTGPDAENDNDFLPTFTGPGNGRAALAARMGTGKI